MQDTAGTTIQYQVEEREVRNNKQTNGFWSFQHPYLPVPLYVAS